MVQQQQDPPNDREARIASIMFKGSVWIVLQDTNTETNRKKMFGRRDKDKYKKILSQLGLIDSI